MRNQQQQHENRTEVLSAALEQAEVQNQALESHLQQAQFQIGEMQNHENLKVESKYAQHNEGYRIENEALKSYNERIKKEHARNVNAHNELVLQFNERGSTLRQQKKMIEEMQNENSQYHFEQNIQNMVIITAQHM